MRIGEPESIVELTNCHIFVGKYGPCLAISNSDLNEHYSLIRDIIELPITSLGAIVHARNYFNKYPHLIPHIDSLREMHVNHLTKRNENLTYIYDVALGVIEANVNE